MPQPPGYIVEAPVGVPAVTGVESSLAVFIGTAPSGPLAEPTEVVATREFQHHFGGGAHPLGVAIMQFFANGGARAIVLRVPGPCSAATLVGGLAGLELVDYFGLLCIPETLFLHEHEARLVARAALAACRQRRGFYLLDAPKSLDRGSIADWADSLHASSFGAVYFPALRVADPQAPGQWVAAGPAASVAGVFARTDRNRGVWKAPAGTEATLQGAELQTVLTDAENGELNPRGINVLRRFPGGVTVWGSRTLRGADSLADDYKYVPVRRLACYIEESLRRGAAWTVFEAHDEALWERLRRQANAFLHELFRQGAFQGASPREAYQVLCDQRTHTQADIDAGVLNLHIAFAPLRPAEFINLHLALTAAPPRPADHHDSPP